MPELSAQFFTWSSLATLAGATGATFVVTNTLKTAFDISPKWLGLVVAQIVCVGTAFYLGAQKVDYVIAVLNGCLVYLSAVGASGAGAAVTGVKSGKPADAGGAAPATLARARRAQPFFASWF